MIFTPGNISSLSDGSGVYKFLDEKGDILYIGKAKNLKKRVASYFQKIPKEIKATNLVNRIRSIHIIYVESEFEALLLEAELIKKHQPKYNVLWKDDKRYIYIRITREEFPTIHLARRLMKSRDHFFGPFPSTSIVREILKFLRTIFPYCTQKAAVKHACFYTHLGLCNPCPSVVRKRTSESYSKAKLIYRRNISQLIQLLRGKARIVEKNLRDEMMEFSKLQDFEKAAEIRNKIEKIDYLLTQFSSPSEYIENPHFQILQRKKEEEELIHLLHPFYPGITKLQHIECYDISHISGLNAAGSMVTFIEGLPAKQYYRKFRIRLPSRPNDFAMLSEVLDRRFNHRQWRLPQLFVIDGGKPQLIAVKKIFTARQVSIPVIGLAKQEEELVIPQEEAYVKVRLDPGSLALHLIQRIRDEAHRFSHAYHVNLRLASLLPK